MSKISFNKLRLTDIRKVSSDVIFEVISYFEKQKVQSSDIQNSDDFGYTTSINSAGDRYLIGADNENSGGALAGAAYMFNYNNSSEIWYEKQKIQPSDVQVSNQFGFSVDVNSIGNQFLIGAWGNDVGGNEAGAAYMFNYNNSSGLWYEKQKIQASDKQGGDRFGYSVSINSIGDKCISCAYHQDTGGTQAGAAYIFNYNNSSGLWYEKQKIQASDKQADDRFGSKVDMNGNGNICVVGAFREDTGGTQAGAVYIFNYNSSSGLWYEKQKIQNNDKQAGDHFGFSLSVNFAGDKCIVGADREDTGGSETGAAYIFNYNSSSGLWYEKQKIQASDKQTGDQFGWSVGISSSDNKCVIGARGENTGAADAGAAYIFNYNSSSGLWYEKQKIQASDIITYANFGASVLINNTGRKVFVSASNNALNIETGGYIFNSSDKEVAKENYTIYSNLLDGELYTFQNNNKVLIKLS